MSTMHIARFRYGCTVTLVEQIDGAGTAKLIAEYDEGSRSSDIGSYAKLKTRFDGWVEDARRREELLSLEQVNNLPECTQSNPCDRPSCQECCPHDASDGGACIDCGYEKEVRNP